jgi:hypothetical protein
VIRVKPQQKRTYADGETKIMDFHIAEKRQGGKHYVIDCKHFPKADLSNHEIDTTLEYKDRSRASKAFVLLSDVSNCPPSVDRYAKSKGVKILRVDRSFSSRLPVIGWLFDASEIDELREEIRSNYLDWKDK